MRQHREYKPRVVLNAPEGAAMTFEEIAEQLAVPLHVVKKDYHQAMRKLRSWHLRVGTLKVLADSKAQLRNG